MTQTKSLLTAAVALVILAGITQGVLQQRWSQSDQLPVAVQKLQQIPMTFGLWSAEELKLDEQEISTGRIRGYIRREYTHAQTNSKVGVLLMVGEAGPISLHPPTVCLKGQGFQMLRQPASVSFSSEAGRQSNTMFRADFRGSRTEDELLTRLYWAWGNDGIWEAAESPRFQFAGQSMLHKLYVTERWSPSETKTDTAVARQFLEDFLPVLQTILTDAPASSVHSNESAGAL